jgi:hypothetical protein
MQFLRLVFPRGAEWLALKLINLVRFFRLIKVQRKLGSYLSLPWVHLGSIVGVYLLCAHCLACLLFFVGRWQMKDLFLGGPDDFIGMASASLHLVHAVGRESNWQAMLAYVGNLLTNISRENGFRRSLGHECLPPICGLEYAI